MPTEAVKKRDAPDNNALVRDQIERRLKQSRPKPKIRPYFEVIPEIIEAE